MTTRVRIRPVGKALGVVFPKELLNALHVDKNDELYAIPTSDGILLTPYDPEFERTMEEFEVVRRQYRNALRELAK